VLQAVGQHGAQEFGHQRLKAGFGLLRRASWARASVRSARVSKISTAGCLADQLLHHGAGGIDAVAREAGGAANQQGREGAVMSWNLLLTTIGSGISCEIDN
jgi:hypothetical protein